jgi:hypothetical protein
MAATPLHQQNWASSDAGFRDARDYRPKSDQALKYPFDVVPARRLPYFQLQRNRRREEYGRRQIFSKS